MQSSRDQNRVTGGMGINDSDRTTPLPFLVDPLTFVLEVQVVEGQSAGTLSVGQRDENRVPSAYGINDTDRTTPMPLLIDVSTGALLVDFIE